MAIILGYYFFMNLILYCMMSFDKHAAIKGRRRIPEKNLFMAAILGGSFGGLLGMVLKRHKTRHFDFIFVFTFTAILHILVAYLLIGKFVFTF